MKLERKPKSARENLDCQLLEKANLMYVFIGLYATIELFWVALRWWQWLLHNKFALKVVIFQVFKFNKDKHKYTNYTK